MTSRPRLSSSSTSPRCTMATATALALLTLAQPAMAGYTVMDDDLFPTKAIPASVAAAQAQASAARQATNTNTPTGTETYSILFRKNIWGLDEEGANSVLEILPALMSANQIVITGRPDRQPNSILADKRANALKALLIKNGIADSRISTRTIDTPTTPINDLSPVDVQVVGVATAQPLQSHSAALVARARQAIQAQQIQQSEYTRVDNEIRVTTTPIVSQPSAPTATVAIIATPPQAQTTAPATDSTGIELIRKIAFAAQAGRIEPKAAITMIAELLSGFPAKPVAANPSTAPSAAIVAAPAVAVAAAPAPAPAVAPAPAPGAEFGIVASAATARPKEWQLSSAKTLKDNVGEWATKEGYTVDWKAANYYKVGTNQALTGELLDAVDRVTTAAGVEMAVWKQTREIWVCDKQTDQCKRSAPAATQAQR